MSKVKKHHNLPREAFLDHSLHTMEGVVYLEAEKNKPQPYGATILATIRGQILDLQRWLHMSTAFRLSKSLVLYDEQRVGEPAALESGLRVQDTLVCQSGEASGTPR